MKYISKKKIDLKKYSIVRVKSSREMKVIVAGFNSERNPSIAGYVKRRAWGDDINNRRANYIIKESNRCVLFFSLQCGVLVKCHKKIIGGIKLKETQEGNGEYYIDDDKINVTDVVPAIEISHFCINDSYTKRKEESKITVGIEEYSIGSYIFYEYVVPIIEEVASKVCVRYVYLFCADDGSGNLRKYYTNVLNFEIMDDMACIRSNYEKDLDCMIIKVEDLVADKNRFLDMKKANAVIEYVNKHGFLKESVAQSELGINDPPHLFEKLINRGLVSSAINNSDTSQTRSIKKLKK